MTLITITLMILVPFAYFQHLQHLEAASVRLDGTNTLIVFRKFFHQKLGEGDRSLLVLIIAMALLYLGLGIDYEKPLPWWQSSSIMMLALLELSVLVQSCDRIVLDDRAMYYYSEFAAVLRMNPVRKSIAFSDMVCIIPKRVYPDEVSSVLGFYVQLRDGSQLDFADDQWETPGRMEPALALLRKHLAAHGVEE